MKRLLTKDIFLSGVKFNRPIDPGIVYQFVDTGSAYGYIRVFESTGRSYHAAIYAVTETEISVFKQILGESVTVKVPFSCFEVTEKEVPIENV